VKDLRPEQNGPIFEALYGWRYGLYMAYTNLEKNKIREGKLDESVFEYVHDDALRNLGAVLVTLGKDNLGALKLIHMMFSKTDEGKKPRYD
jgi:hypothetical protein